MSEGGQAAGSAPRRTFVGFGFGAIQAGLFLYEAQRSGAFSRLVVAEVMPDVVESLRAADGYFTLNVAHADRIEQVRVGPVEAYDPNRDADREALIEAIGEAEEMATAVPSVAFYTSDRPGSIHNLLAQGIMRKAGSRGPRAVIYAAENHNHAAELLSEAVMSALPKDDAASALEQAFFANTVIGKMSGVVGAESGNATITPDSTRVYLVEAFNTILSSQMHFSDGAPYERGITVFVEKPDLLPFEEAKLYGHKSLHALAAYLGGLSGCTLMSQLGRVPGLLDFTRAAAIEEPGIALCRKYDGVDSLFTPSGFTAYVDDLIERMTNPFLQDAIERVARDPLRKLAWHDRLIGAMRIALNAQIEPRRFAIGAAAAMRWLNPQQVEFPRGLLPQLWQRPESDAGEVMRLEGLIEEGWTFVGDWIAAGYPDIEVAFPSREV
jgi:mannitol-1-phosphate 5-dehydrogenase